MNYNKNIRNADTWLNSYAQAINLECLNVNPINKIF